MINQNSLFFRTKISQVVAIATIFAFFSLSFFSNVPLAHAEPPAGTSAVIQNTTATTVDVVITGTDFDAFESSDTATANATDLAGITYDSVNPTAAVIDNSSTMTLTFAIAIGSDKSGGSLTIDANMVEDASNTLNSLITIVDGSITDSAKPFPITATFYDATSNDGKLDIITVIYSEDISAVVDGSADWAITSAANFSALVEGTVECNSGSAGTNECDYNFTTSTVKTNVGDLTLTYTAGTSVTDGSNTAATIALTSASAPTFTDTAKPIVTSITPASAATGVDRTTSIVIIFSEPMDTTFDESTEFTVSPDPGNFSEAWTNSDQTVTLTHTNFICGLNTVATVEAEVVDAAVGNILNTSAAEDGDWTFYATGCSSSGSTGTSTETTYEVIIDSPNGGEIIDAGSAVSIEWTSGGSGTVDYANLYYSIDGGTTYSLIEEAVLNVGSYSWLTPMVSTADVAVKVELTDLAEIVATDTSDQVFTVNGIVATDEPTVAPTTGGQGISPVTGELEDISEVSQGNYIKSSYFDTVYYVDSDMVRHPFMDAQTFFTWQNSFGNIQEVTDATLMTLDLGAPMLPKPEVVLMKIQSNAKVYAIVDSGDMFMPELRWVASEAVAIELYGADWSDYVIDVPVTLFSRFQFGADIISSSDLTVDTNIMKTRVSLN